MQYILKIQSFFVSQFIISYGTNNEDFVGINRFYHLNELFKKKQVLESLVKSLNFKENEK